MRFLSKGEKGTALFGPKTPKRRERENLYQILSHEKVCKFRYLLDAKMGKHLKANIRCNTIYTTCKL